jgi:hypothetical protein
MSIVIARRVTPVVSVAVTVRAMNELLKKCDRMPSPSTSLSLAGGG